MGYRAYTVKKYEIEYDTCLGFNCDFQGCYDFLKSYGLEIYYDDSNDSWLEVKTEELLALDIDSLKASDEDKCRLKALQNIALESDYARNGGYIRVEWL
ncbi:hypothetical protein [Helicobacter pullorum]|uniref:hypothetical protein n=1 Tax=Helicobacter pullorum TaxID=35818 RepID=UPI0008168FB7|nr:hypothetical protein [Helicobacter pullorum]OCR08659.1 hypothetical protein A7X13_07125 [Helicobacter pullorum]